MAADSAFPNLLAPGRIGKLTVRNRMIMPPMGTNFGTADGFVTRRNIDYYEARAAGGVGVLIVEYAYVDSPLGAQHLNQLGIFDDKFLPAMAELAATIKRHGARAMIQIHHAGREAFPRPNLQSVAPSALQPLNPKLGMPRALTVDDIRELVQRFVDAAERAQRAGFEGVELHAAHAYLLGQFLTPLCNIRTDEYGGSVANRARFVLDIVRGIRERLGDFPVSVRISAYESTPGGITIESACEIARLLEGAGVDIISISAGGYTSFKPDSTAPARYPSGFNLHLPESVKRVVRVPVVGVGRLNTPAVAEAALRDGKCDFVALGRALIADPEFPNKAANGLVKNIRPCIACMHCIQGFLFDHGPVVCALNPFAGREREAVIEPAVRRKKVSVIGGGLAGMEAARTAAMRGHDVTLVERGERLGGQLIAAAIPPFKDDLNLLLTYYQTEVANAGVVTMLGNAQDAPGIIESQPEAVIVATGSRPLIPMLPGIQRDSVVLAEDVLLGVADTGQRVVIIGGELVGCETAEFLAQQGRMVTIARRGPRLATNVTQTVRRMLLDRLSELQVTMLTGVDYEEINDRGLVITAADGTRQLIEADTVVIAAGSEASNALTEELRGRVPAVEVIGDAVKPRRFLEAIWEGMAAGRAI